LSIAKVVAANIDVNRMAGQLEGTVTVEEMCGGVNPSEFLPGPQYTCIKFCLNLFFSKHSVLKELL